MSLPEISNINYALENLSASLEFRDEVGHEEMECLRGRGIHSRLQSASLTLKAIADKDFFLAVVNSPFALHSEEDVLRRTLLAIQHSHFIGVADDVLNAEAILRSGAPMPSDQIFDPKNPDLELMLDRAVATGNGDYQLGLVLEQASAITAYTAKVGVLRKLAPEQAIREFARKQVEQSSPPFDSLVEKGAQRLLDLYVRCP